MDETYEELSDYPTLQQPDEVDDAKAVRDIEKERRDADWGYCTKKGHGRFWGSCPFCDAERAERDS